MNLPALHHLRDKLALAMAELDTIVATADAEQPAREPDPYRTPAEFKRLYNVSRQTLHRAHKDGRLPAKPRLTTKTGKAYMEFSEAVARELWSDLLGPVSLDPTLARRKRHAKRNLSRQSVTIAPQTALPAPQSGPRE